MLQLVHLTGQCSLICDLHTESGINEMPSGQLIANMETAKDSLWKQHGTTLLCFISRTFLLCEVRFLVYQLECFT